MTSNKSPVLYFIVTQLKTYSHIQSMNHKKEFKYLRTWHKACVDCCFAATWPWSHKSFQSPPASCEAPRHVTWNQGCGSNSPPPWDSKDVKCQGAMLKFWFDQYIIDNYWIKLTVNWELFGRGHNANPPSYSRNLLVSCVSYQVLEITKLFSSSLLFLELSPFPCKVQKYFVS